MLRRLSVLTIVLSGALLLAGCGTPTNQAASSEAADPAQSHEGRDLADYPVCPDRGQEQADHGRAGREEAGRPVYIHDLTESTVGEAKEHFRQLLVPHSVPDWVSCIAVDVFWESDNQNGEGRAIGGSVTLMGFEQSDGRAMEFRMFTPPPVAPPPLPGDWRQIEGRSEWWQDMDASEPEYEREEARGVRIGWVDGSYYFEITGPFTLDEALSIADSVGED